MKPEIKRALRIVIIVFAIAMFVNALPCMVSEIDARVQVMQGQMSGAGILHFAFCLERKWGAFCSMDSRAILYGTLLWDLYFALIVIMV